MKDIYGVGLFYSPITTPWEMLAFTGFHRAHGDFFIRGDAMKTYEIFCHVCGRVVKIQAEFISGRNWTGADENGNSYLIGTCNCGGHNIHDGETIRKSYKHMMEAAEYRILLCTGGPAVRIIGELGKYAEPETARIEYQDWDTPWEEYVITNAKDQEALLTYCRQFYFGE